MENYILIALLGGGFVVADINRYAHTCADHTHLTLSTEYKPQGINANI